MVGRPTYPRLRLDIRWRDLAAAALACLFRFGAGRQQRRLESRVSPQGDVICCLSERSAFDLYLRAVALPPGSEVLMSAANIPDMARIAEAHRLVPVPVDIEPATLAPSCEALERAATPQTRAVLIAHLFGSRVDLGPIVQLARRRGWLVIEDCAQSFAATEDLTVDTANEADVSLFSFGPIKTATALAGGLARVADRAVLDRMRRAQRQQPLSSRRWYVRRVFRFALLKALSQPLVYTMFIRACRLLGRDYDGVVQRATRGFPGPDLFPRIRQRPSAPLSAMLGRRLHRARAQTKRRVDARAQLGQELTARLSPALRLAGSDNPYHSHWVYAVLAPNPPALVAELRAACFDATSRANMTVLPTPAKRPDSDPVTTRKLLQKLVYVPAYPELPRRARKRLGRILAEHGDGDATTDATPARYGAT